MDIEAKMNEELSPYYHKVLTLPNIISFLRLCLVPIYFALLMNGYDVWALVVFSVAALTDFVDGKVARSTHTVSLLGKLLDPAIDTILMISGVFGVFLLQRIPLWIVILILARELFLLIGGSILLKVFHIQVPVVYLGKFATTFLFVGFAALLFYMPTFPGLGITDISWLPGFNGAITSWGIWFVYVGLILQIAVTVYYCAVAFKKLKNHKLDQTERA